MSSLDKSAAVIQRELNHYAKVIHKNVNEDQGYPLFSVFVLPGDRLVLVPSDSVIKTILTEIQTNHPEGPPENTTELLGEGWTKLCEEILAKLHAQIILQKDVHIEVTAMEDNPGLGPSQN